MARGYRPYLPDQDLLLPPSLRDWLPEDHLVYFVSDVVDQLDLSAIHARYGEERRGQPPYDPSLMTKLLVYGYCTGVFSSRRIQKRLREDIPFKVLAAGNEPDFRTISDFRKNHLEALQGLFEQVLEMALESGAMKLGRVSLEGTKVKANASKHKAMSYGRMKEKQQQLKQEVQQLLAGRRVAQAAKEKEQLPTMVETIAQQAAQRSEAILADNGYGSEKNLGCPESTDQPEQKMDGYIATGKRKHGEHRNLCKPGP